jgi:hypothetical protein
MQPMPKPPTPVRLPSRTWRDHQNGIHGESHRKATRARYCQVEGGF